MDNGSARVLKADNVTFEGQVQLDVKNKNSRQQKAGSAPVTARVNVVEKCAEYVIIEMACTCGKKIHVKCVYENN